MKIKSTYTKGSVKSTIVDYEQMLFRPGIYRVYNPTMAEDDTPERVVSFGDGSLYGLAFKPNETSATLIPTYVPNESMFNPTSDKFRIEIA